MALTKIPASLSSTPSIVDGGNATALTIDSSENITLTGTLSDSGGLFATRTWTTGEINSVIDSAPGALNTLNELAAAMGDDANFSTTVTNSIATKLPLAGGTMTGDLGINQAASGYGNLTVGGTGTIIALRASSGAGRIGWYEGGSGRFYMESLNGADGIRFLDGDGSTEHMRVTADGKVGIGIPAPSVALDLAGYMVGGSHRTDNAEKHMKYMGIPYHSSDTSHIAGMYINGHSGGNYIRIGGGVDATSAATEISFHTAALTTGAYEGTTRLKIKNDGYIEMAGAADLRVTIGSQGTAGNNDSNWIRGSGSVLMYNSASDDHRWEIGGDEAMRIDANASASVGHLQLKDGHPWIDMIAPDGSTFKAGITARGGSSSTQGQFHLHIARDGDFKKISTAENYDTYLTTENSNTANGNLIFGTSTTERMRIRASNGYVGIGTTEPNAVLEISGKDDAGISDLLRLQFDNSPADTGITFTDINSTVKNRITMDSGATNDLRISAGTQIHFYTNNTNGTASTGTMSIYNNGVVEIPNHLAIGGAKGSNATDSITVNGAGYRQWYMWNSGAYFTNGSNEANLSSGGAWNNASDERYKENIVDIPYGTAELLQLKPRKYNMKEGGEVQIGLIAQEVETIIPEVVEDSETGYKSMSYGNLNALLIKTIQELEARIKILEG